MRLTLKVLGVLVALMGLIWFLQGINLLPGSFMTGQVQWAIYGVIALAVGIGLFFLANRVGRKPPDQ
jgi:hypothetical protein